MPPKQGQPSGQQGQKQQVAHFKPGQVHYTTLEGIPEGAPVMTGMFSINDQPVTVLFDSGASHTFISKECATRLGLGIETMSKPYYIHSPRGSIDNQSDYQASASTASGEKFYDPSDHVANPESGYHPRYELDEISWDPSGHFVIFCAYKFSSPWFYDPISKGP